MPQTRFKNKLPESWPDAVTFISGAFSAILGILVVIGWRAHNLTLIKVLPSLEPMRYNTALCFFASGAGLIAAYYKRTRILIISGAFMSAVGLVTVFQYASGIDTGIDRLFMVDTVSASYPGRMAPSTALAFLFAGMAFLLAGAGAWKRERPFISGLLGAVIFSLAGTTTFGYAAGVAALSAWGDFVAMALHTGIGLIAVGAGVVMLSMRHDGAGERDTLLWLPAMVAIGVLTGTLILWRMSVAQENANIKRIVHFKSSQIGYDVQDQMEYRINALVRMAKRWEVRGRPSREDWESDASLYLTHYQGYHAMAWIDRSLGGQWVLAVKDGQTRRLENAAIKPLINGAVISKGKLRREVTVTGPSAIEGGERVFAAFVPIGGESGFDGYLAGIFKVNDLFDAILLHETGGGYSIAITDGAQNLYGQFDAPSAPSARSEELDIRFYNAVWHVKVWPNGPFLKELSSPLPAVILAVGFLMSSLLALVIYLARTAGLRANAAETSKAELEREVAERVRTEKEVKRHAEALEESNAWLEHEMAERRHAEQAVARHAAELERSNAELEQFAYVASHDLQEPLRIVAGYVQLLQRRYKGRLDADADEFIRYAVDGASRMQMLISDLLTYSRVGKVKEFAPVDCKTVFNRTIANLQKSIMENGATVTGDGLPTLVADASQLEHLFLNLVGNAIKYRSNAPPLVNISAVARGSEWQFCVKDNGIGIDPKHFERIFVIFQRLHGKTDYPGTGIGLSICKKVIENHGGRIWVESEPGRGTSFYFTIPLRRKEK